MNVKLNYYHRMRGEFCDRRLIGLLYKEEIPCLDIGLTAIEEVARNGVIIFYTMGLSVELYKYIQIYFESKRRRDVIFSILKKLKHGEYIIEINLYRHKTSTPEMDRFMFHSILVG